MSKMIFLILANLLWPIVSGYDLPAGANEIIEELPIKMDFDCSDREYGYYADVANNCQLFHICLPIEDAVGIVVDTSHWTFVCSNGTIFDQQTLSCNFVDDAFPCEDAEMLYGSVTFGLLPGEVRRI